MAFHKGCSPIPAPILEFTKGSRQGEKKKIDLSPTPLLSMKLQTKSWVNNIKNWSNGQRRGPEYKFASKKRVLGLVPAT